MLSNKTLVIFYDLPGVVNSTVRRSTFESRPVLFCRRTDGLKFTEHSPDDVRHPAVDCEHFQRIMKTRLFPTADITER